MKTKAPCKECDHRAVGCHATCEQYKDWQIVHEDERAQLRRNMSAAKEADYFLVVTKNERIRAARYNDYARRRNERR